MCQGWRIESRNNPVASWYISNRTWRKVKDNGVGDKKLLVARDNKRYGKICGRLWYMSKDKE